jgi:hypothetical protein
VTDRNALERKTAEFVSKPYALNIFPIPTESTGAEPFCFELGDDVITVPTIKKAYGKNALLVRLLNNTPNGVKTYVKINGSHLELDFGKFEVKTLAYEDGKLSESYELLV